MRLALGNVLVSALGGRTLRTKKPSVEPQKELRRMNFAEPFTVVLSSCYNFVDVGTSSSYEPEVVLACHHSASPNIKKHSVASSHRKMYFITDLRKI